MTKITSQNYWSILSGPKIAFTIFILTGGYYLWSEHQAHLLAALPYAIFLLCPLMHLFMHRGHGDRHTDERTGPHAKREGP